MSSPSRMRLKDLPDAVNEVSGQVLNAAIKVHTRLGPGLLENAYKMCLAHELALRGLRVAREVPIDVEYEGLLVEGAYLADIVVEDVVIVEAKAVDRLHPIFEAQLLTYLRLFRAPLGILLNFHAAKIMDGGFRRLVLPPRAPPASPAPPR